MQSINYSRLAAGKLAADAKLSSRCYEIANRYPKSFHFHSNRCLSSAALGEHAIQRASSLARIPTIQNSQTFKSTTVKLAEIRSSLSRVPNQFARNFANSANQQPVNPRDSRSATMATQTCTISTSATTKSLQTKTSQLNTPNNEEYYMNLEHTYGAHNYHPLPVVLKRGKGVFVWDVNNKKYYDFLSAYSAVNQGHCHDRLVDTMVKQCQTLTLTSRAFHNDLLGKFEEKICKLFKYEKFLPMNSGVEACDTAIKLARRFGYMVKQIPPNQATVIFAKNNFWGRSLAAVSASNDESSYKNFGPFMPCFESIPYNDIDALEQKLKSNPNICAFMAEPIQGEAGVCVPDEGYLSKVSAMCKKYNVLFIADEVQTGLGRTGKWLCVDHESVRPDIICLGKALSGGFYPVSGVLASNQIMNLISPGEHGSTYGGNPLAAAIGMTALDILKDEGLVENAERQGKLLRELLNQKLDKTKVTHIRGKGLLNAIIIDAKYDAWEVCLKLKEHGLLAKPTHGDKIRFAPPLCITSEQVKECADIIARVIDQM